jgi:DNA-binding MarR family transcriptional regulator
MKKTTAAQGRPEDYGYADCLIACPDFLLSTVALNVTGLLEDALAPLDLRLRHYRILRLLFLEGPQSQVRLGAALGVDRTTVVALVDHLERKKLLRRERSTDDRRAYAVTLTAKGRTVADRAIRLTNDLERQMFAPLDRAEQETLRKLSTRLLATPGPIADAHGNATRESS